MENCKHEEGWIMDDEIVIEPNKDNDDVTALFECLSCNERRRFRFDIRNIKWEK